MINYNDAIDKTFGKLTLIKLIPRAKQGGGIKRYASGKVAPQKGVFKCTCGKEITLVVSSVVHGSIKECTSCACNNKCPHRDIRCRINYEDGVCCWECDKVMNCTFVCFDNPDVCGRGE